MAEAIALLDRHLQVARDTVNWGIGVGIGFESPDADQDIGPREIIDAHFHGYYLHSGNEKSELAKRLDDLEPWPRFALYTVMLRLHNVYWAGANAAERPLDVPALIGNPST